MMPLKIIIRSVASARESGDLMVVGTQLVGAGRPKKGERSTLDGFDQALGGALGRLIKREDFRGKKDQQISLSTLGKVKAERIVVIGLGDTSKLTGADLRTFAAKAARAANADKAKRLVLGIPEGGEKFLREIAEGLELGAYRFTKYFTGDRKPKAELAQVTICLAGTTPKDAKERVDIGQTVANGLNIARDLSNEPPNVIYPDTLAEYSRTVAKDANLKILTFDYKEIVKRGMKLLQAVGQGSEHKPTFIHFSYVPASPKRRIVFVGKGITFDTGGISIKPAAGMGEMKHDMSGAANVVGLMAIVGKLRPDIEVHGIVAAAENMPDGNAYRPGDVWGSLDGKTVEIINTDAEGRLVLADALAYARSLEPDILVDNATLTGAMVVALGNGCSGWYASNESIAEEFAAAAKGSGEQMWRMPILEDLKDQLKSDSADLRHTGDRYGGSITATLFLREFIGAVPNWVHCDIAGPAMGDRVRGWDPKGGTGHGVLTFLSLIDNASANAARAEREADEATPLPAAATAPAPAPAPTVAKAAPRGPTPVLAVASAAKKAAPAPAPPAKKAAPAPTTKKKSALPVGVRGGTKPAREEGSRSLKGGPGPDDGSREPQGRLRGNARR